ncbi:ribokinase-like [Trichogramma pretiosum]|uniref:ribokinase-like n=1 Tax=Trichogramma pretiosum TaxID=7493 RepID=UPI0006C9BE4A|nr:ribokinase-like [Trichogramma pretiosum]XP_014226505.1 ribokinase-like [Trichogramma pretiosum]XP_014226506.1 ribokinase-like [Trichogramma pretiosum]
MTELTEKIVVVGSCMIDFITYSSRLPKPGETLEGSKFEQGFGGKGANQCVTAARLGASTLFVTALGSDALGHDYMKKLKDENVSTDEVLIKDKIHTGVAQIAVAETGENSIVIIKGANGLLSKNDVINAKEKIQAASVLICQLEIPMETTLEALRLYNGHGISIMNAAPAPTDIDFEIFKLCDIFCVNEIEAEAITGIKNVSLINGQLVADSFLALGCDVIIITLGAQGVIHASQNDKRVVHAPVEPVKAVDTTGAGDAFIGALAYYLAYHKNLSLNDCIVRANKIAGYSVMKTGTQSSFPYKKDLPSELF